MPKLSVTRRLLRELPFPKVKLINAYLEMPPRHSKQALIAQIIRCIGPSLNTLVCADGPFSLTQWNDIAVEIGGSPRNSFESVGNELEGSLDPVYDELDGDTSISQVRDDKSSLRKLAGKLGLDRAVLEEMLLDTHGLTQLSTFVTRVRKLQSESIEGVEIFSGAMRVASTRVSSASLEVLSENWMSKQMLGADHICIAAGFYDCEFLQRLFRKNRTIKSIRLLFNGLGGNRLSAQRDDLKNLERQLSKDGRSIEVRLAFAPGLFHTKLFLITKSTSTVALIGSANATAAAFDYGRNEEVLVALNDSKTLAEYFETAWNGKSTRHLDDLETSARSLVAFFRTGILYFKPVVGLSLSLNPFREVLKSLTNEERATIGGSLLPYADQEAGIGAFNLRLAVTGNGEYLDGADDISDDPESRKTQARIKPWSVETCFGYWVPSALDNSWKSILEDAGASKRQRWESFREMLLAAPEGELERKYQEYVSAVGHVLKTLPSPPTYSLDPSIFQKFIGRILLTLEDERRLARLVLPFTSGAIPEIWDDAPAYEDFRTAFFDYLSQVARAGNKPRVPNMILRTLDIGNSSDGEELLGQFEDYLRKTGWTDADWN